VSFGGRRVIAQLFNVSARASDLTAILLLVVSVTHDDIRGREKFQHSGYFIDSSGCNTKGDEGNLTSSGVEANTFLDNEVNLPISTIPQMDL
jgi:hypothetical protein